MLLTKKISPTEFRLNNKAFYIDYAPSNYFERFRFELIFSNLVKGLYINYGIYFYLSKLKVINNRLLFQIYFYRVYERSAIYKQYVESLK